MKPHRNPSETSIVDAETLALRALAHIVGDAALGPRFLALTGLEITDLRDRAGDPALLAAVLGFLEGHEPSLVACAAALEVPPAALIAARAELAR